MAGGAGFGRLIRAEWVKLRTVLGMAGCLLAAAAGIATVALLISAGSPGTFDDTGYVDQFRFVHRPLSGDGTLTARVRTQDADHTWGMAGIMFKESATPGAPYASVLVTRGHGVRMQANFTTDIAGSARRAPRHLKLTRTGNTITGYESADGTMWTELGAVTLPALPPTVQVGLFATSPGMTRIHPMRPAALQVRPETSTFDGVRLTPATPQPDLPWTALGVGTDTPPESVSVDGVVAVTGSGDIIGETDDGSRVVAATAGTIFAALPAAVLGTLVMTSEYRWRIIGSTLTAGPRRGRMLAAKAVIVAATTFAAGLAATLGALLASQPLLRRNGYRPPLYPDPSLLDPTVLRVVAGTAAFLALLALFGLGVGTILRHGAAAIAVVGAAVLVPVIVTPFLPTAGATWLSRLTPVAGMSLQQVRETDDMLLLPWAGRPWHGFLVLCGYAAATLGAGYWLLRRRDAGAA